jgi:hypothetical protein
MDDGWISASRKRARPRLATGPRGAIKGARLAGFYGPIRTISPMLVVPFVGS